MNITREEAAKLVQDYDKDKIFSVTFVKRTDGSVRTLVGRKGVMKGVTGVGLSYDPRSKGLLPLFDVQKDQFRMINLETVLSIRMDGCSYEVK